MKTISLRQPWAYAVVRLGKRIENRNWPTPYRGPLLIHAAKGIGSISEYQNCVDWMEEQGLAHKRGIPGPDRVERGGIVGICRLVDCIQQSNSPWFEGPYGFVLDGVEAVEFYPCVGALGLFDVAWPPQRAAKEGLLL